MLNKLIKFHLNYVFNRINLLLFLLLSIFIFCSNMFIVIGIDNKAGSNESFLYYLDSSFSITKLLVNPLSKILSCLCPSSNALRCPIK